MTPTHDPTSDPEVEVDRPAPGRSRAGRLLLAAVVVVGVLLLGWFLFVYAEPDVPAGPAVDEIEQEEDDAIDSTDG